MNNEQRKALVEELAEAFAVNDGLDPEHLRKMDKEESHSGSAYDWVSCISKAESCMPIIDRLLTTHAAPTVDDDAVERAAKALLPYEVPTDALKRALAAAAPGAFDLDAALDSLDERAWIDGLYKTTDTVWRCVLFADGEEYDGTGPTRIAAIQAAVANAKKGAGQ